MGANTTLNTVELETILNEVSNLLENKEAVGVVTSAGPFVYFISKGDSGLPAKIAVAFAQGSKVLGVLFMSKGEDRAFGRYQLLQRYKDDQSARQVLQEALDEILSRPGGEVKSELLNLSKIRAILQDSQDRKKTDENNTRKDGVQSLGDLSGCDAQKLTDEQRDRSSRLRGDKEAQENALDEPHHLIFYSAVDQHGETRFFDVMRQSNEFSVAETAIGAAKLGHCVETVYRKPDGGAHHVHRLYGKFRASTARKAIEDFARLAGLNQVTEIAETQTQREALPTWRFIFKRLGAVPNQDFQAQDRESSSKAETSAGADRTAKASTKLVQGEVAKEEASDKKSPSGIGGWLAVFVLALFVNGMILSFESLNMPSDISNALPMGMGLSLAVLAFSSAILITRKNPRGILLAKVFIGANLFVNILAVIRSVGDASSLGAASAGIGRVLLFSIVWMTYLQQSVRVRNTFGSSADKNRTMSLGTPAKQGSNGTTSTVVVNPANGKTKQKAAITLLILAVAAIGLSLFVTVVRNYSDNRTKRQSQVPSSDQPKTDYVARSTQMGAAPVASMPVVESPHDYYVRAYEKGSYILEHDGLQLVTTCRETLSWLDGTDQLGRPMAEGDCTYMHNLVGGHVSAELMWRQDKELRYRPYTGHNTTQTADVLDIIAESPVGSPIQLPSPKSGPEIVKVLNWIHNTLNAEDGNTLYLSKDGMDDTRINLLPDVNGCDVSLVYATRSKWKETYHQRQYVDLANLDPTSVKVTRGGHDILGPVSIVTVYTTDKAPAVHLTANDRSWEGAMTSDSTDLLWELPSPYAARFAKAFHQAITLCGGKQSSF